MWMPGLNLRKKKKKPLLSHKCKQDGQDGKEESAFIDQKKVERVRHR